MKKLLAAMISAALLATPLAVIPTTASAQTVPASPAAQEGKVGAAAKSKAKAKPKAKAKHKAKHKAKKHAAKKTN